MTSARGTDAGRKNVTSKGNVADGRRNPCPCEARTSLRPVHLPLLEGLGRLARILHSEGYSPSAGIVRVIYGGSESPVPPVDRVSRVTAASAVGFAVTRGASGTCQGSLATSLAPSP